MHELSLKEREREKEKNEIENILEYSLSREGE